MKKIDQLLFQGKSMKGFTVTELNYVIERLYLFIEEKESNANLHCPVTIKKDDSNTRKVWVEKLRSWILIPKDFDILQEEIHIQRLLSRAKQFKKVVKEKKLDIMPMPNDTELKDQ